MWQSSYDGKPTLYLVPTPIGTLEDITFRSLAVLRAVNVVFYEDTRVSISLFNHFDIKKKLFSLHEHNENKVKDKVLSFLKEGKNVAIVSDRGTPLISDPGFVVVKYVAEFGYNVVSLPGACALVSALVVSGIESMPFMFFGFLDNNINKRRSQLDNLASFEYTMIFYEAPHRIKETLMLMLDVFGDRQISLSREISKKFESVYRGSLKELLESTEEFKGEFVIVVSGNKETVDMSNISIIDNVSLYIKEGFSVMEAIKKVAKERKIPKNEVYKEYHGGSK